MAIIIDGYNLLHATGIIGGGVGPGTLERSRAALLNFLAESLDPAEVPRTVVVFDARSSPSGQPRRFQHRDLTVHFAPQPGDADALIEELIAADSAPRQLVVVSSDHRIQRAARRRRAQAIDSDQWYAQVLRDRRRRQLPPMPGETKPAAPLSEVEVQYWLTQFGQQDGAK